MATRRSASRSSVTGAITDLQRRIKLLQSKSVPTRLANQVVARSAIQPRAVSTDQIALNAVTDDQIAADAVKREQIDVGAVGTTEIGNLAVTTAKINDEAVVEDKIGSGAVVEGKIGPLAVTNGKIQDAAVQQRNMSPNSVENGALLTDSVNFRTIAVNAVGNENMLDNSVGNSELQNGSVSQGNLQNDSVGFGELRGGSVGTSTLQNGSVSRSKIGSGQVGTTQIENRAVTGGKIALSGVSINEINMDRVGPFITSAYVYSGSGISVRGGVVSANFGGGSNQIPRGNHRHSYNNSYYRRSLRNGGRLQGFLTGGSQTGTASSRKFKKTISTHKTKNPKNLLDLKLKKFKYKRSFLDHQNHANKEWSYGYMIEDLLELGFDEVIYYSPSGEPERLDYGLFSTLVLELVKLQQTEIEYLKEEIKNLKEKK